jgi:hypothetical protein
MRNYRAKAKEALKELEPIMAEYRDLEDWWQKKKEALTTKTGRQGERAKNDKNKITQKVERSQAHGRETDVCKDDHRQ